MAQGAALGHAQVGSSSGAHEAGGDVQELVAQLLWFGQGMLARQEEGAGPGEQVDADQGELEPGGVDGELAEKRPNPLSFPVRIRSSTRAWVR